MVEKHHSVGVLECRNDQAPHVLVAAKTMREHHGGVTPPGDADVVASDDIEAGRRNRGHDTHIDLRRAADANPCGSRQRGCQSARSAAAGGSRLARMAGRQHAASAARSSVKATAVNTRGSSAPTPNSRVVTNLVEAAASPSPTRTPAIATTMP